MIDFLLPSMGADMDEGKLVRWLVKEGDPVQKGQIIAEVETDKATLDVECWDEGVVEKLVVAPGPARLRVGTILATIRPAQEMPAAPPAPPPPVTAVAAPAVTPPRVPPPIRHLAHELGVDLNQVTGTGKEGRITRQDVHRAARPRADRTKASPRARQLAMELGVDLDRVVPTGKGALITTADVLAASPAGPRPAPAPTPATEPAATPTSLGAGEAHERAANMRRAIARSMSRSKREIPHYYLASRVVLAQATDWLEVYNSDQPLKKRVLPTALLLKATALALREHPELNGYWIDEGFQASEAVHLGVAISLREGGLVAPAIHHADRMSLGEIMEALTDLVNRARSWRLRSSEMSDPTATVTNLGDRGVEVAYPIIIPPQVAMIGFGRVIETPVARNGMVGVAPTVQVTLSGDHRATDGHRGGLLLMTLDKLLQEPEKL
jgi:pyruvate dehydrogenase E2 component (dihydrolipoamide acetyltransferase)